MSHLSPNWHTYFKVEINILIQLGCRHRDSREKRWPPSGNKVVSTFSAAKFDPFLEAACKAWAASSALFGSRTCSLSGHHFHAQCIVCLHTLLEVATVVCVLHFFSCSSKYSLARKIHPCSLGCHLFLSLFLHPNYNRIFYFHLWNAYSSSWSLFL